MAKHVATSAEIPAKKKRRRRGWLWVLICAVAGLLSIVLGLFVGAYSILGQADIQPYNKGATYGGLDMMEHDLPTIHEGAEQNAPILPSLPSIDDEQSGTVKPVKPNGSSGNGGSSTGADAPAPGQQQDPNIQLETGSTLQQLVRNWCANGEAVSSNSVLNILLVGMDNKELYVNGRADSMMLLSVNTKTRQITLASLLRDQYAYINSGNGESFEKMHHSNYRGGPELLIKTIEQHYKVQIDNYIMVNLTTFPKIIDRLGGVDITLTQAEIDTLKLNLQPGKHHVDGALALRYSRIRKIDSEQQRTGRQRAVMTALINQMKSASLTDLIGVINDVLPYVRTGMTQSTMISLATRAVTEGWQSYGIKQLHTPDGDCWRGRMLDDLWYWLVDYPDAARTLQLALYGKSNITLNKDRKPFYLYPIS